MKKIIAIGGGEIAKPLGSEKDTTEIDKEIIKLTGLKNPKLLFISTASSDALGYIENVKKHFGKRLKCQVDTLELLKNKYSKKELSEKVLESNIIYVGGGNTAMMLKVWKKYGMDKLLEKAYKKGVVLAGLSAGSICWFKYGSSDSKRFTDPSAPLIRVPALNFIKFGHCPHHNQRKSKNDSLESIIKKKNDVAIALDDCCAMEVINDTYKIISTKKGGKAYKIYWKNNTLCEDEIKKDKNFKPLKELLKI